MQPSSVDPITNLAHHVIRSDHLFVLHGLLSCKQKVHRKTQKLVFMYVEASAMAVLIFRSKGQRSQLKLRLHSAVVSAVLAT